MWRSQKPALPSSVAPWALPGCIWLRPAHCGSTPTWSSGGPTHATRQSSLALQPAPNAGYYPPEHLVRVRTASPSPRDDFNRVDSPLARLDLRGVAVWHLEARCERPLRQPCLLPHFGQNGQ
nr:MAG TPA: hypothetical protein [Caudoviricetes sp.]